MHGAASPPPPTHPPTTTPSQITTHSLRPPTQPLIDGLECCFLFLDGFQQLRSTLESLGFPIGGSRALGFFDCADPPIRAALAAPLPTLPLLEHGPATAEPLAAAAVRAEKRVSKLTEELAAAGADSVEGGDHTPRSTC